MVTAIVDESLSFHSTRNEHPAGFASHVRLVNGKPVGLADADLQAPNVDPACPLAYGKAEVERIENQQAVLRAPMQP